MTTQIKQRRDTAANWTSNNPTLGVGELGWETDTRKAKLGDGATAWTGLSYIVAPDSSALTSATSFSGDVTGLYNALVVGSAAGEFDLLGDATITNTGTLSDYALGDVAVLRWNGASALTLTGIANGGDGRLLIVVNVTAAQTLTLSHDATSSAANRFYCPNSADLTVPFNAGALMVYDATSSRWRVLAAGSITTDAVWAAKGDLLAGTGNNAAAILTVGSNDQVLTADSAQATGLKWATPSAVGGGATYAGVWRYPGI